MNGRILTGRVAVVTGAGRGIGRAAAALLASKGVRVAAVSRTAEQLDSLAREHTPLVHPFPADVSEPGAIPSLFERIRRELGPVTILIACAGTGRFGETLSLPEEVWHATLAVNLTGLYLCNVEAIRQMLDAGGGDIVNVLSVVAEMAAPRMAAYAASKAGALGLTRSLAAEFRARGVRITALLPGATDTPLWDLAGSDLDRSRMMKAEDVAGAAVWCVERPESAAVDALQIMPKEGFL
jgi:short-subunit dehydrogenase